MQAIKSIVYKAIPVVFISVPHKTVDIVNAEREMNSRYIAIEIPIWKIEELEQIAIEGFNNLNIEYDKDMVTSFTKNSYGSPFIMQELCLESSCDDKDLQFKFDKRQKLKNPLMKTSEKVFYGNVAIRYVTDEFKWVLNGTKSLATSQKRVPVERLNGQKVDTFEVVTEAISLSKIDKPIEYSDLKKNIKAILKEEPDWSRITHVLKKISTLAYEISSNHDPMRDPILEWNSESKIIYILDPFLKFFIKWRKK